MLVATPVFAQQEQEAEDRKCATYLDSDIRGDADALTLEGVACFEAGQYEWALTHYRRAHELNSDPFLLGGIGRSLHELGLYGPAMHYYRRFLDQQPVPSGADRIRGRIEELEGQRDEQGGTVSLRSAPPAATTYLVLENGDWYELGETPVEVELQNADYQFVFDAEGYRPRQVDTDVDTGKNQMLDAELVSEESALGVSARGRRRASFWTAGGSLIAGAAGGALLLMASQESSQARELDPDNFSDERSYQRRYGNHLDTATTTRRWGTISSAVAVAGLATAGVLYLSTLSESPPPRNDGPDGDPPEPDESSETTAGWDLQPTLGLDGIGVRGRF